MSGTLLSADFRAEPGAGGGGSRFSWADVATTHLSPDGVTVYLDEDYALPWTSGGELIEGLPPQRVARPISSQSLVDPRTLAVGDRVRCEIVGTRCIVVGVSGGAGLYNPAAVDPEIRGPIFPDSGWQPIDTERDVTVWRAGSVAGPANTWPGPAYRINPAGIVSIRGTVRLMGAAPALANPGGIAGFQETNQRYIGRLPVEARPAWPTIHQVMVGGAGNTSAQHEVICVVTTTGHVLLWSNVAWPANRHNGWVMLHMLYPSAAVAPQTAWTQTTPGKHFRAAADSNLWGDANLWRPRFWIDGYDRVWFSGRCGVQAATNTQSRRITAADTFGEQAFPLEQHFSGGVPFTSLRPGWRYQPGGELAGISTEGEIGGNNWFTQSANFLPLSTDFTRKNLRRLVRTDPLGTAPEGWGDAYVIIYPDGVATMCGLIYVMGNEAGPLVSWPFRRGPGPFRMLATGEHVGVQYLEFPGPTPQAIVFPGETGRPEQMWISLASPFQTEESRY